MTEIKYQKPAIVSAEVEDTLVGTLRKIDSIGRRYGKFVVMVGKENNVKLYGLLYSPKNQILTLDKVSHDSIEVLVEGLVGSDDFKREFVLGGGFLNVNHDERSIFAHHGSSFYGSVPEDIVRGCLIQLDYEIDTYGLYVERRELRPRQREWYERMGIELE